MRPTVPHRQRGIRRLAARFAKLPRVILLASTAFSFTFGLLVTFLGIGVIANVLIVYAVIQVLGERQQNEEHRSRSLDG
jgi:Flp pilus assembly protein TadB